VTPTQELEIVDALKAIAKLLSQTTLLLSDLLIITSRVTFTARELGVLADIYHHYGETALADPAQFRDAILALGNSFGYGSEYRSAAFKMYGLANVEFKFLVDLLRKSPPPAA
jgi:hypothetical protein